MSCIPETHALALIMSTTRSPLQFMHCTVKTSVPPPSSTFPISLHQTNGPSIAVERNGQRAPFSISAFHLRLSMSFRTTPLSGFLGIRSNLCQALFKRARMGSECSACKGCRSISAPRISQGVAGFPLQKLQFTGGVDSNRHFWRFQTRKRRNPCNSKVSFGSHRIAYRWEESTAHRTDHAPIRMKQPLQEPRVQIQTTNPKHQSP